MDRQWVVGVDTDESSRGALILAKWLARFGARGSWDVRGVHVIRDGSMRNRFRAAFGRSPEDEVRGAVAASVAAVRAANDLDAVDLVHACAVEEGLTQACGPQTLGILIGRSSHAPSVAQLGKTTRNLLRTMHCPLAIVPSDLEPERMQGSTLIIATDLSDRCAHAAAFGRWLAHLTDLEPVLVHVARPSLRRPSRASQEKYAKVIRLDTAQWRCDEALRLWSERYGLGTMRRIARVGSTSAELLTVAREQSAAWIVCGSGPSSLWERLSHENIGARVAAAARVPTVAVPPDLEGVYPWSRVPTMMLEHEVGALWRERSSIVP